MDFVVPGLVCLQQYTNGECIGFHPLTMMNVTVQLAIVVSIRAKANNPLNRWTHTFFPTPIDGTYSVPKSVCCSHALLSYSSDSFRFHSLCKSACVHYIWLDILTWHWSCLLNLICQRSSPHTNTL